MKLFTFVAFLLVVSVLAVSAGLQRVYCTQTLPWGVERIRAYCAWDNNGDGHIDNVTDPRAGQNQIVAVIDCGIDYLYNGTYYQYHEDLNENMFRDWLDRGGVGFRYDWWTKQVEIVADHRDDEPQGYYTGHGTHVSGTIAAVDNDVGVIGTAPKVLVYMLKLCTLNVKEVVAAINYVVYNLPANIISMSFSYDGSLPRSNFTDLENACQRAYNSGRLLFAASGNDNRSVIDYPAKYDSVVAVGAVFQNLSRWVSQTSGEGSNFGPELDVVAPGVDINSTWVYGNYHNDSGTSMAVPHVAAETAMIWSSKLDRDFDQDQDGVWDAPEVLAKLYNWTLDLGQLGRDDMYGLGLVNAWATSQRPIADINNDYKVDAKDLAAGSRALWSHPGDPNWDPRADINIDNKIDAKDLALISRQYGQKDP